MKKNRWIAAVIWITVVLSGCGDRRELTEIGMVGAVAYDAIEGQTNVWMDVLQQDAEKAQLVNGAGPGCQEAYEAANENWTGKFIRPIFGYICWEKPMQNRDYGKWAT